MASSGAKIAVAGAIGFATLHEAGAASMAKDLSSPAASAPASMEQILAKTKAYDAKTLEASQESMQLEQTRSEIKVMPQTHELRGTGIVLNQERRHERGGSGCK